MTPQSTKRRYHLFAAVFLALFFVPSLRAAILANWISWTAPASYPQSISNFQGFNFTYATNATGTILLPDNSTVNMSLNGEIMNPANYSSSAFGTTGNSYWVTRNYNGTTYISANVPDLPSNSDRVAVSGAGNAVQTLTFSKPVSNIVMNIWSLGAQATLGSWQFDQPFVILSQNAGQYPATPYALQAASGNTLNGYEGRGTIQFTGTFSSLSWNIVNPEVFAVWNIGVTSASAAPAAVPEPGTWAAAALLVGGAAFMRWRKRAKAA